MEENKQTQETKKTTTRKKATTPKLKEGQFKASQSGEILEGKIKGGVNVVEDMFYLSCIDGEKRASRDSKVRDQEVKKYFTIKSLYNFYANEMFLHTATIKGSDKRLTSLANTSLSLGDRLAHIIDLKIKVREEMEEGEFTTMMRFFKSYLPKGFSELDEGDLQDLQYPLALKVSKFDICNLMEVDFIHIPKKVSDVMTETY